MSYIAETKGIMDTLKIPVRTNYLKDGPLMIIVSDDLSNLDAKFGIELGFKEPEDYAQAIYQTPVIGVSRDLHLILTLGWYYSDSFTVRVRGNMIHEIAHYLQSSNDSTDAQYLYELYKSGREKEYFSYLTEMEAFAVDSYYWLRYYKREELALIMASGKSGTELFKHLIDAARLTLKEKPLFRDD